MTEAPFWAAEWEARQGRRLTDIEVAVLEELECRIPRMLRRVCGGGALCEGFELRGPASLPVVVVRLSWEHVRPGLPLAYARELGWDADAQEIAMNLEEDLVMLKLPGRAGPDGIGWITGRPAD